MIASSRPGTQPATLQGIWNDQIDPPWGSKYTTNINLQMNYWLRRSGEPRRVHGAADPACRGGERHRGRDGGCTLRRARLGAAPQHGHLACGRAGRRSEMGPLADGRCLALRATLGPCRVPRPAGGLVRRLYPLIAGAARFILDTLVPLPGTDCSSPTHRSRPRTFIRTAPPCAPARPWTDRSSVIFSTRLIEAAVQLGIDDPTRRGGATSAPQRLPADRIGQAGQLQEWLDDWDMDAPEINHRHVSHLYGLYPSRQIDLDRTPNSPARLGGRSKSGATTRPAGASAGASICGRDSATAITHTKC